MSLSQFMIIYSANLPEEVTWYLTRTAGGWWRRRTVGDRVTVPVAVFSAVAATVEA